MRKSFTKSTVVSGCRTCHVRLSDQHFQAFHTYPTTASSTNALKAQRRIYLLTLLPILRPITLSAPFPPAFSTESQQHVQGLDQCLIESESVARFRENMKNVDCRVEHLNLTANVLCVSICGNL